MTTTVASSDYLGHLPEPLRAVAPDNETLLTVLSAFVADGGLPGSSSAAQILGLDEACEQALTPEQARASIEQLDPDSFRFFREMGVRLISMTRSSLAYEHSVARYSKAHEVSLGLEAAATETMMPLLLLTTSEPGHPLFSEFAPQRVLTILCPHGERLSGDRLTLGGFRSPSDRDIHAPEGWTEIRVGSRPLGWVSPNRRILRLRIHPFLAADKLSASRLTERVAMLVHAIELARPHLDGVGDASDTVAREQHKADWRESLAQAETLRRFLVQRLLTAQTRIETHRATVEQAQQRISELTDALCAAIVEADEHQTHADALAPVIAERAAQTLSELGQTLTQVSALPSVRSVSVRGETLQVETGPLHVQAAGRLVEVGPLTVGVQLAPAERLVELVRGDHPAVVPGATRVELGELFIPVAQSVAAGNLFAAVQIVLGMLSAPVAVPQDPERFTDAAADARPGFIAAST